MKDLEQVYLEHSWNKASPFEKTFLSHHGILGQKWGIRRFQNNDGTRTALGKKRYSSNGKIETEPEKSSFDKRIEEMGYTKDSYGSYEKNISSPSSNLKEFSISADYDSSFSSKMDEEDYFDLLSDIEKNFNDIQLKIVKSMANYAYDNKGREPWFYDERDKLPLNEKKELFIKNIGTQVTDYENDKHIPGFAYIRVMGDGYGEFAIDDGGAYGNHCLTTELDWKKNLKNPKVKYFSVEG